MKQSDEFVYTADEPFDREEMNRLFQLGYGLASSGYEWNKEIPRESRFEDLLTKN
jgi:hypothetical protein